MGTLLALLRNAVLGGLGLEFTNMFACCVHPPVLDQVQAFLPQMAQANEKLRKEMAASPAGHFNIENVDETTGNIIQMDVALFEMNRSDSKEEDSPEESSQDSSGDSSESEDDDCIPSEVTIENIKLPKAEGGKGKIEVLDSPASKKKKQ